MAPGQLVRLIAAQLILKILLLVLVRGLMGAKVMIIMITLLTEIVIVLVLVILELPLANPAPQPYTLMTLAVLG